MGYIRGYIEAIALVSRHLATHQGPFALLLLLLLLNYFFITWLCNYLLYDTYIATYIYTKGQVATSAKSLQLQINYTKANNNNNTICSYVAYCRYQVELHSFILENNRTIFP